jgi:hypothetical protein
MKHKQIKTSLLLYLAVVLSLAFLAGGCSKKKTVINYKFNTETAGAAQYPDAFFAVISDTHFYDASLGSSGQAFEKVMFADRKLLLDSVDLLEHAMNDIIASGAKFVLISGDLTKDGELINHQHMADKLKHLTNAGIHVYVVPGNHDINNPDAVRFDGDTFEPVPSVSAEEFAQIYGNYGFNSAVHRDKNSLSYVAEPVENLWILAIDSARYRENIPGTHAIVGGKISQETADWIAEVLQEAKNKNKAVLAVLHHGVVEHWEGQAKLHPDYLLPDYADFSRFLASWNVRVAFTGHYHAQDIVRGDYGSNFIYDIETGSLVTAPCPVRYIDIKNGSMNVRTDNIVGNLHPGTDFAANAYAFVKQTVMMEAADVLARYRVSAKDTDIITDAVGDAFVAHYNGDENPAFRTVVNKSRLGLWGRFILSQQQYVLDGMWADPPPADNNVLLDLRK